MIKKIMVFLLFSILITGVIGDLNFDTILMGGRNLSVEKSFPAMYSGDNMAYQKLEYQIPGNMDRTDLIQPQNSLITAFDNNRSNRPRDFKDWSGNNNPPPNKPEDDLSLIIRLLISTGVMVAILILVTLAGLRIGTSFKYECCKQTQKWIGIGHIISALLIAVPIWIIYTIQTDTADMYILATMYALIGVLIYLLLSSLVQAGSIITKHPVPPVYHIHILFFFIAISLILMGRVPFFPPLPNTFLAISVTFLPGAVLSLLTAQIVRRNSFAHEDDPGVTFTHPRSIMREEITSSFPNSLKSRYRDISIVGSGGVAVVYRATRVRDGQQVALKIPFSPDESSGKTFLNEMAIWRDLHHPSIVEVFDQNIFPVPYVEMEYLGRSLRDITYPVAPEYALSLLADVSSALLYAHNKGVIHRDIKPGNVLVTDQGRAKLTDWGLSRSLYRVDETKNTSFSLYYATPEQLAPEMYGNGDQRTDIYQLGVLLYELICGEPPYVKAGIGEMFIAIQKNEYQLPSANNSSLARFDNIIKRTLKANPSERFSSISEFMQCLHQIMKEGPDS